MKFVQMSDFDKNRLNLELVVRYIPTEVLWGNQEKCNYYINIIYSGGVAAPYSTRPDLDLGYGNNKKNRDEDLKLLDDICSALT